MTRIHPWIARYPVLSSFLFGAILATIASIACLRIYDIFITTPDWVHILFYPGFYLGSVMYAHVVNSVDISIITGIIAVALVYGTIAAGLCMLVVSVRKRRST